MVPWHSLVLAMAQTGIHRIFFLHITNARACSARSRDPFGSWNSSWDVGRRSSNRVIIRPGRER
jgi:hypothetical protein